MVGTVANTIPAQNVTVTRAGAELTLVNDVKILGGRHAINVLNTRSGAIDSFVWRIREIEITVAWTKDLQDLIESDNQLSNRSALSFKTWIISGLTQGGSNDITYSQSAAVFDYSVNAPDVGTSTISIKLRVARTAT